jgi:hypothetical protein
LRDSSNQSIGHRLIQAVFVFVSALFAAWAVDVAVNFSLLQRLLEGVQAHGTPSDYLGLLVAETQVAAVAVVVGFIMGPIIARLMRSKDSSGFSIIVSAAMLSGLVMLAQTHTMWKMTPPHDPVALAVGH